MPANRSKKLENVASSVDRITTIGSKAPKISHSFNREKKLKPITNIALIDSDELQSADESVDKMIPELFKKKSERKDRPVVTKAKENSIENPLNNSSSSSPLSLIENRPSTQVLSGSSPQQVKVVQATNNGLAVKERKLPKPKPCRTSYMCFVKENRGLISTQNPTLSVNQVSTRISEIWESLEPEQKEKYELMAIKDRDRWNTEREVYALQQNQDILEDSAENPLNARGRKRKNRRWIKIAGAPKKPLTPYIIFGKTIRSEVRDFLTINKPGFKPTDVICEISSRWNMLTPEEKLMFEESANQDKERYLTEKKEWLVVHDDDCLTNPGSVFTNMFHPYIQQHKKSISYRMENILGTTPLKIVKVRCIGEDYFDKIHLMNHTFYHLVKRIQVKREDPRSIASITQLPDIRIRDDEDVNSLPQLAELEIVYSQSHKRKSLQKRE